MALSPALGSGHDARRVIATNIPQDWSKDKVYSIFSLVGNIMDLELPFDYDCPINVVNGENLYRDIMGLLPIDLTSVHPTGFRSHNLIADFRDHVLAELKSADQLLQFKGNNSSVILDQLAEVWGKIRKFKDLLGVAPCDIEDKINSSFSQPINKTTLSEVKNMILNHFNKTIGKYYMIKGYAKITFATREQAERAIGLSSVLVNNFGMIRVLFDRNLPDYFYNTRLVAEAQLREMFKIKSRVIDAEHYNLKINHHVDMFNTKVQTYINLKSKHVGDMEPGDPLANQSVRTELESKDMIAGIEGIDSYGGQRRSAYFNRKFQGAPKNYFSSSDDFFEVDHNEEMLPGTTRIYDKKQDYTKKLMNEYIVDLNDMPVKSQDVKTLNLVPELPFPKEIPPTRLWSSSNEKIKARQLLMGYEEFFHEKIPDSVYEDPNLKFKDEHGEFPNARYVYEPPYEHLKTPSELFNKDKRKVIMQQLRQKIRNINAENVENLQSSLIIEQGEEELRILENANNMKILSDDEEDAKLAAKAEEHAKNFADIDNKILKKYEKAIEIAGPDLMTKRFQTNTKKFKYEGDDIDEYVKNLNKIEGMDAKYSKNEAGDMMVHVVCKPKYNVDFEEVKILFDKYGKQFEVTENVEDIEIDEEDQEKLQRFMDLDMSSKDLFEELLAQVAEKNLHEKFNEYVDLEQIHKWGQFTPMVNDHLDKEEVGNTIYDFSDIKFQDKRTDR